METMFVTGYSYKGGVGRTTALANIACLLAEDEKHQQRVLLWDFDLEAPGLHRLFPGKEGWYRGFVDLAYEFAMNGDFIDPGDFIYESRVPGIDVFPAGVVGEDYCRKLARIDWPSFFGDDPKIQGPFFGRIVDWIKDVKEYDYVFIDSRTGLSDIAGICTQVLPDILLVFFRLTEQNIDGISHLVPVIREQLSSRGRSSVEILPIVSPVLSQSSDAVTELRRQANAFFPKKQLEYIRFDADLVTEERLFCRKQVNSRLWPEPAIVDDYKSLSRMIRKRNPHDTLTLSQSLRRSMEESDFATARRKLSSLIRRRPDEAELWRYMRIVCRSIPSKEMEFGDQVVKELEADGKVNEFALEWKAAKHADAATSPTSKELVSATTCLQDAAKIAPERSTVYRWLSEVAGCRGDLELATQSLEKVLEISSDNIQSVLDLANLFVRRGRDYFMVARKLLEPHAKKVTTPLLVYLWSFYGDEFRAGQALEEMRRARDLRERDLYFQLVRAYSQLFLGRNADARASADAVAFSGSCDVANWAEFLICLGEFDEARSILQKAKDGVTDEDVLSVLKRYEGLIKLAEYLDPSNTTTKERDVIEAWKTKSWDFTELLFYREHESKSESCVVPDHLGVIEKLIQICSLASPRTEESIFWRRASGRSGLSIERLGRRLTLSMEVD